MAAPMFHENRSKTSANVSNSEEDDPLDKMIRKTGCLRHHHDVQECMAEKQDWRQCQEQVQTFRKCMSDYEKRKAT